MMLQAARNIGILLGLTGLMAGAAPVATVSSAGTFELRGKQVKTDGVPSWPMMEGDEIGTSGGPATIQFRDGSRVTLNGKSRAKVEKSDDGLVFRLLSGAMQFTLAPKPAVAFYNGTNVVPARVGVATTASTSNTGSAGAILKPARVLPPPPPPISGR